MKYRLHKGRPYVFIVANSPGDGPLIKYNDNKLTIHNMDMYFSDGWEDSFIEATITDDGPNTLLSNCLTATSRPWWRRILYRILKINLEPKKPLIYFRGNNKNSDDQKPV